MKVTIFPVLLQHGFILRLMSRHGSREYGKSTCCLKISFNEATGCTYSCQLELHHIPEASWILRKLVLYNPGTTSIRWRGVKVNSYLVTPFELSHLIYPSEYYAFNISLCLSGLSSYRSVRKKMTHSNMPHSAVTNNHTIKFVLFRPVYLWTHAQHLFTMWCFLANELSEYFSLKDI